MQNYIIALKVAASGEPLRNDEFYNDPECRALYEGDTQDAITTKIGYLIGFLRKKGMLRTVTRGPPATYEITALGRVELRTRGLLAGPSVPKEAPPRRTLASYDEPEVNVEPKPKRDPPEGLPKIVGTFEGAGLNEITVKVRGCQVKLKATGSIIGYLLANDLLRKRVTLWLTNNEVVWVEKHEYEG